MLILHNYGVSVADLSAVIREEDSYAGMDGPWYVPVINGLGLLGHRKIEDARTALETEIRRRVESRREDLLESLSELNALLASIDRWEQDGGSWLDEFHHGSYQVGE